MTVTPARIGRDVDRPDIPCALAVSGPVAVRLANTSTRNASLGLLCSTPKTVVVVGARLGGRRRLWKFWMSFALVSVSPASLRGRPR